MSWTTVGGTRTKDRPEGLGRRRRGTSATGTPSATRHRTTARLPSFVLPVPRSRKGPYVDDTWARGTGVGGQGSGRCRNSPVKTGFYKIKKNKK